MLTLGLDVCSGACAAAVTDGTDILASLSEPMKRGHVERLAPMVGQILDRAGLAPHDLDTVAVTTGPGSFTGARLGVAFARGLALATGAQAVGVSLFEVMAEGVGGTVVVALDGGRGDLFVQRFDEGIAHAPPLATTPEDGWRVIGNAPLVTLTGSGCDSLLSHAPQAVRAATRQTGVRVLPETVAIVGARRAAGELPARPAPLYMRAADAKPAA